jgi:hypothetical protein
MQSSFDESTNTIVLGGSVIVGLSGKHYGPASITLAKIGGSQTQIYPWMLPLETTQ